MNERGQTKRLRNTSICNIAIVLHSLKDKVNEMEWISTKDRLPDEEEDVLISTKYEIYIAYLHVYNEQNNKTVWIISDDPTEGFDLKEVLAWMPLPKIYHAKKRGN